MARLEDIVVGARVTGITGSEPVDIVAVTWHGSTAITVTHRNAQGTVEEQLLFRDDEEQLGVLEGRLLWSFDGDAALLKLSSEAYRINLAHIFDPYLAVHSSEIEPLPHQISAVYEEMLPRIPLRFVLADDPGAGKTIMTGLLLKELIVRGDLKRCLIVCPGNLEEQWQDELFRKFNLRFELLTPERIESAVTGNAFNEIHFCIARMDRLAWNDKIQEKLRVTDWDLIVCDEAHKMSARVWGGEIHYSQRFSLGRLLSSLTRHFLLLTATPHNGKEEDFQLFMSLIDQDRFEGVARTGQQAVDVSDVMRRLIKEDLLKFDGTPLFPERRATTVNYDLSPQESALYDAVTQYVQDEFNRADQLTKERKNTVGFALTILQRRLASSPEAIYQSLKRRRERLEARLAEEKIGRRAMEYTLTRYDEYDDDDLPASELESEEEKIVDQATASRTIAELEAEIEAVKRLEHMANEVRQSGNDSKWKELSGLLQDDSEMVRAPGVREKLIIFTEHRDTLNYLTAKIRSLLGNEQACVTIHGGLLRDERRKVEALFKQEKEVHILVATDAAGEGINLQQAHLMVNYDLPWNPNRLEQRFGRIHRIGQTEVCHLWNLVAKETREGMVFQRLFEKLEQERETLKGKVFDVLGKITFDNKSLKELLIDAIRYGNREEVRNRLYEVVDHSLNVDALKELIQEHALTETMMDIVQVSAIREEMERLEARRLQPHFIESFFLEAFELLGGKIHPRETGRYEISNVPARVRSRDNQIGWGEPVLQHYHRICFDKAYRSYPQRPEAAFIVPGHPLLEAVNDLIREQHAGVLKQGAVFIDESDYSEEARLLFYIEDSVQDGVLTGAGKKRIISKHIHFVEIKGDGSSSNAGYAPYLDYRAAREEELQPIRAYLAEQEWLQKNVENRAIRFAITEIIPPHVNEVKERRITRIEKTLKAVEKRLRAEIRYWDFRANELKEQEDAGKSNPKVNSMMARQRANDLALRLDKRRAELALEKSISATPPIIVGGALVLPKALVHRLCGNQEALLSADVMARKSIEYAAMEAVIALESALGYIPKDVSHEKVGYDIESQIPLEKRDHSQACLRFIEVKGRAKGAQTVTVTKNEILTALNKPDEFILAIVEVDEQERRTTYLKNPFKARPAFAATSITFHIEELIAGSEILLT
ncbi:MAG: helicase-related protein [Candidatus Hydrogenedentales bacterium]